jgi:hypothetical protein
VREPFVRPEFVLTVEQDEATGKWRTTCPLCGLAVTTFTEHGVMQSVCDHMNERHPEPRSGNA